MPLKTPMPNEIRLAARMVVSRGLAVIRSKTLPTKVVRVGTCSRMASMPVVGVPVLTSPFLKTNGCGGWNRTNGTRRRDWYVNRYTTPRYINTLSVD
jgi:hypothetical protein